jgi:alpha-galactosidase
MNKNDFAPAPPMGWNSWDCYGASVNEEQLLGNADYMAMHLKQYGWEYIVCDIQWYEPQATSTQYNSFYPLCMDEYSRLIPAENRFPSAKGGAGFKPIADYIHNLGLKFGIHIMRGIPRQAVHAAAPIKGTSKTARDIAHSFSICSWNTDMYGVNPNADGAQEYYDSLFDLYASWGVDFVKVDDICITEFKPHDLYSAKGEIEMIRKAIDKCGRPIVLSLSPGPALLEQAEHLSRHANMWRMTGDFWDNWPQLYNMFEKCHQWSPYVKEGCWPDCDMLPLGRIEINNRNDGGTGRNTCFTKDEQITMMTLWSIFRSPLMLGTELRGLDDWTLSLITNEEVIRVLKHSYGARQIMRTDDTVVWKSKDEDGSIYVAFFNTSFSKTYPSVSYRQLGLNGEYEVRDLWTHEGLGTVTERLGTELNPHGAALLRLREVTAI